MNEPGSGENLMRISDVAKAAGLTRQVVQYYLMLGLIREKSRSGGGHRLFDQSTVRRVKLICRLNRSGYTLRDIGELFLKRKRS